MAIENDLDVFSVRLPRALGEEVRKFAIVGKRSRNSQIVLLLEQAVDLHKVKMTRADRAEAGTLQS